MDQNPGSILVDKILKKRPSSPHQLLSLVQRNKIISTFPIDKMGNARGLAHAVSKVSLVPIAIYSHESTNRPHGSHRRFNQIPTSWQLIHKIEPRDD